MCCVVSFSSRLVVLCLCCVVFVLYCVVLVLFFLFGVCDLLSGVVRRCVLLCCVVV